MIAGAQFTIVDLNDPIQQGTAPSDPTEGMLWLDTSSSPALLKRYNGAEWEDVGDSAAGAEALEAVKQVQAQINTTATSIRQEVQATYASTADMTKIRQQLTTLSEQTENNFTWTVSQYGALNSAVQDAKEATEEQLRLIQTYMTFSEDGLVIGKSGNPFTFRVVNDRLAFYMNNTEVAYLSNNKLYVTQAEILTKLQVGKFAFEPQTNGNMSLIYTG